MDDKAEQGASLGALDFLDVLDGSPRVTNGDYLRNLTLTVTYVELLIFDEDTGEVSVESGLIPGRYFAHNTKVISDAFGGIRMFKVEQVKHMKFRVGLRFADLVGLASDGRAKVT